MRQTILTTAIVSSRQPLGIWVGLNVLDAMLTFYMLGLGWTEANPMLGFVESRVGTSLMLVTKLAISTTVGVVIVSIGRAHLLRIASALMGMVVAYNSVLAAYALGSS